MRFDVVLNTEIGLEELVKEELLKEFKIDGDRIVLRPNSLKGKVLIKNTTEKEVVRLNYCGRGFHRVLVKLGSFRVSKTWKEDERIYYIEAKNIPFEVFISSPRVSFGVDSIKVGEGFDYTSIDLRRPFGQGVIDRMRETLGFRPEVNLSDPDVRVLVEVVNELANVYIDTTGKRALFKRGWRVYYSPASIKASTAFLMILLSEWGEEDLLVDPFTGSATIPIEAAHYGKRICPGKFRKDLATYRIPLFEEAFESVKEDFSKEKDVKLKIYGFDKDAVAITNAKKNARMAKVLNDVRLGVLDVKYLFTKFSEGEIDRIVTNPPWGIRMKEKKLGKVYYYLFDNAVDLLSQDGYLALITTRATLVR